jgi:hypothetical protein
LGLSMPIYERNFRFLNFSRERNPGPVGHVRDDQALPSVKYV